MLGRESRSDYFTISISSGWEPFTLASYSANAPERAYVEPIGVGDPLPDMPVFLDSATYILAPLEQTYIATWETCPEQMRELIAGKND